MPRKSRSIRRPTLAALLAVAAIVPTAAAKDKDDIRALKGYVDGSKFLELADDDSEIVHVTIDGPMMKMIAKSMGQQAGVGELLGGVKAINAVVIQNAKDAERGREMMKTLADHLKESGWERLALVRQKNEFVVVYVLPSDDYIEGLVVLVHNKGGGGELVFANIAGRIDLSKLEGLTGAMQIPGLANIPTDHIKKNRGVSVEVDADESDEDAEEEDDGGW